MEGEFCDGRTNEVCDPAQGRRDNGLVVPGVRHLAQDRCIAMALAIKVDTKGTFSTRLAYAEEDRYELGTARQSL